MNRPFLRPLKASKGCFQGPEQQIRPFTGGKGSRGRSLRSVGTCFWKSVEPNPVCSGVGCFGRCAVPWPVEDRVGEACPTLLPQGGVLRDPASSDTPCLPHLVGLRRPGICHQQAVKACLFNLFQLLSGVGGGLVLSPGSGTQTKIYLPCSGPQWPSQ